MKKKLLFIGPIGDIGGRELETGFMAKSLSNEFDIEILSTGNLTFKSQIFDFVSPRIVQTLNECIYKSNFWFRTLSQLSAKNSKQIKDKYFYTSNTIAKKTGYRAYANKQLKEKINNSEIVILCMQLTSNYIKEIVEYSFNLKKPIVLRTSTTINHVNEQDWDWLKKIDLFIHHSESNASKLNALENYKYTIIDQCTYKEKEMLNIQPTKSIGTLLYVGRISEEKGIIPFVNMFNKLNTDLRLKIVGDGSQFNQLKTLAESNKNIELLGFLSQDEIVNKLEEADAAIIPSYEESGPLIGLEAMASAKIIISTKVGAMATRLDGLNNQFWFNVDDIESFKEVINEISNMSNEEIEKIALENRTRYLDKYQMDKIRSQYKNAIFKLSS
jgi:glycosyltransferase involved in cell wall biosynthesis